MISAIAAVGRNRELGKDNKLLWKIPEDMKHFRGLTDSHPIIMGRKTWESIGRALPNRTNIIVTRNLEYKAVGAVVVSSLDEALSKAEGSPGNEEIFIIGGADIYTQALPHTDRLYLTVIGSSLDADAFFPDYSSYTKTIQKSEVMQSGGLSYYHVTLER